MRKKLILILFILLAVAGITAKIVYEKYRTSPISKNTQTAQPITSPTPTPEPDPRIAIVAERLSEEGSPLTGQSHVFVDCGSDNNVDPYLLVGITNIESSFGKNACGGNPFGWNSCKTHYSSLEASCQSVAEGIATKSYYSRFRQTDRVEDLANVYCPPSAGCNTTNWVAAVQAVVTDLQDREFIKNMENLTDYLPANKTKEQMRKSIEELKKLLETATGTNKEVIEILIRANERALAK